MFSLSRENILKVAVVLVVLFFILNTIAIGVLGKPKESNNNQNVSVVTGMAIINVTVKGYEPLLIADSINESFLDEIKAYTGVDDVLTTSSGYVISLKSTDDVQPVWRYLFSNGIPSKARAILSMPNIFEITTQNKTKENVTGFLFTYAVEPYAHVNDKLPLAFQVVAVDGQAQSISQVTLLTTQSEIITNATILSQLSRKEVYVIPWEERNDVNVMELKARFGDAAVNYRKDSSIIFEKPLTLEEQMLKKFPYISYISENTATVADNFTDSTIVRSDFGNGTIFPNSTLEIFTQDSADLPYQKSLSVIYEVAVPEQIGGFATFVKTVNAKFTHDVELNSTVEIKINALTVGSYATKLVSAEER